MCKNCINNDMSILYAFKQYRNDIITAIVDKSVQGSIVILLCVYLFRRTDWSMNQVTASREVMMHRLKLK